jgi:hypothetical protein
MRKLLGRHKAIFIVVPFFLWIGWVLYAISHEKPKGAETPAKLRAAATDAIQSHNSGALNDLFADGEVVDDYGKHYLAKLKAARVQEVQVNVSGSAGRQALVVTGRDSDGLPVCTAWEIEHQKKNTWVLDGTPPLRQWCPAH